MAFYTMTLDLHSCKLIILREVGITYYGNK